MSDWCEGAQTGMETLVPQRRTKDQGATRRYRRYHVILWDSDDHTFDYVERMLRELFGHTQEQCHQLAEEVHHSGRATVLTTSKEHAELKRDQILAYGKDQHPGCSGSMWSTIESET